jgi:hypothetical protein
MTKIKQIKCLDALELKLLAMALMLCDHTWAVLLPQYQWLTSVGRLAFPIFAFQAAEGFFQTKNFKKYLGRMFLFALISEVPFDLMYDGGVFYPFHQNVMFTFCIALVLMRLMEKARKKGKIPFALSAVVCCALGYVLGVATMVDYYGCGVLTVLLFYLCRGRKFGWLGELFGLYYINVCMLKGLYWPVTVFGLTLEVYQQGLALLALIPIWLYSGRQGRHSWAIQYGCYAFYPAHMLALVLLAGLMAN